VGPAVGQCVHDCQEVLENALNVLANVFIAVANRGVAPTFVDPVTDSIFGRCVSITVDLHDQTLLGTKEIYNAVANNLLPTELEPAQL